ARGLGAGLGHRGRAGDPRPREGGAAVPAPDRVGPSRECGLRTRSDQAGVSLRGRRGAAAGGAAALCSRAGGVKITILQNDPYGSKSSLVFRYLTPTTSAHPRPQEAGKSFISVPSPAEGHVIVMSRRP